MRRTIRLGLFLAAALAALPPTARAAGPRLLLDAAELEPSWFGGLARLRLHVTAIQLEGSLIPVGGADPFVLMIGGSRRREPYLVGRFGSSGGAAAIIVLLHTGWEMRDDLDAIRDAASHLLDRLPAEAQVAVMSYGEEIEGGHRLGAARAADQRVDRLEADPAPADPQLVGAVERAVATLGRARASAGPGVPVRRMVIALSDGKDADPDPARYRAVGQRADKLGIRIHSIAYSPADDRGPLLGLGELSKRSGGTFRWVRASEGFRAQVDTLLAEINQQYVLTYFLPADQVVGKRLAVRYRELESNEIRLKKVACGGGDCAADRFCVRHTCVGRGGGGGFPWRWILIGAGGLVGLLLVVGGAAALAGRARAGAGQVRSVPQGAGRPGPHGPVQFPTSNATILVVAGPFQGQRLPLRHGFLVGSARGCDLLLSGDPRVAPHHAVFVMDPSGGFGVLDRGSPAGTFVNGVRITEARLQHGNLIRIGGCDLRFLQQ